MKKCPQCGREYDNTMSFCLDDGAELLYGPASADEPQTAILQDTSSGSEGVTRAQMHTTEQSAASRSSEVRHPKAAIVDKRLLVMPLVVVVIALGAFAAYRYFQAGGSGPINSIAVLPFENRSSDSETDYLSDGLAESLIFRLTQLPELKVSPTSSVMRYKGREGDIAKIAGELGVDAVMTGRLMKRGDNLNITVELVDARNNKSLWGEQYERRMSDLLATQREIAATIAQKLQLKLSGNETGVVKKYTDNNEAYQLWMKARFHFLRRTKEDMERAIELYKQATDLDPNFALAYVGIAETYTSMPSYPYLSPNEASPKAKAAIEKALTLDPDLPDAQAVAGMIATTDWDYATADRAFKRAIELGPNLAITHYRYGWTYLSTIGRHEDAIAEMKRAVELEPLAIQQGANYAAVLMYARRYDEAVAQAKRVYELDPNHIGARNWLCYVLSAKGSYAEALAVGERAIQGDPSRWDFASQCLGLGYAGTGQRQKVIEIIAKIKAQGKERYYSSYSTAMLYAAIGDKDAAFAELETSFRNHDWFLQKLKVDPLMDALRDDPRFDNMIRRLNYP